MRSFPSSFRLPVATPEAVDAASRLSVYKLDWSHRDASLRKAKRIRTVKVQTNNRGDQIGEEEAKKDHTRSRFCVTVTAGCHMVVGKINTKTHGAPIAG